MKKIFLFIGLSICLISVKAQDSVYYLKSKIPLVYNKKINQRDTGYVYAKIISVSINPTFNNINIYYYYLAPDSVTILDDGHFILSGKVYVDGLYNTIKIGLPGTITSYSDYNAKAFILAFQYEMALTWGISTSQIYIGKSKN